MYNKRCVSNWLSNARLAVFNPRQLGILAKSVFVAIFCATVALSEAQSPPGPPPLPGGGGTGGKGKDKNTSVPSPGGGGGGDTNGGGTVWVQPAYSAPGAKLTIPTITNGNLYFTLFDQDTNCSYNIYRTYDLNLSWQLVLTGTVGQRQYVIANNFTNTSAFFTLRSTCAVATPVFSPAPGLYGAGQEVAVTCATFGSFVFYTTNGVDPTPSDFYLPTNETVFLDCATTLKAKAFKDGVSSSVQTGAYGFVGAIAAGNGHSLWLRPDGNVFAWGANDSGQLGDGTLDGNTMAKIVPGVDGVVQIAAGNDQSFAVRRDGTLLAWGFNNDGELGLGAIGTTALPVISSLSNVVQVAAGRDHALAATFGGTLWSWGINHGQLGNGLQDEEVYWTPGLVLGLTNIFDIAGGGMNSLAVTPNGRVYAWGYNTEEEYGNGQYIPTLVAGITNAIQVQCGMYNSFALANGFVWAWGANDLGQLGNGSFDPAYSPLKISGLSNVVAISSGAGGEFCLALRSDGTVWAWGNNYDGELGNGNYDSTNRPVRVLGLTNIVSIAAGAAHALALQNNGTLWGWGANSSGQLGNSDYYSTNRPVIGVGDVDGDGIRDNVDPYPMDFYNGLPPVLTISGGNNQTGSAPDTFLGTPLSVSIRNGQGVLLTNAPVTFTVSQGGVWILASTNDIPDTTIDDPETTVTVRSGSSGVASVFVFQPFCGDYTNLVTVSSGVTNASSVTFSVISLFDGGAAELAPTRLAHWKFDTSSWVGDQSQLPLIATNLALVSGLSTNAVLIDSNRPPLLRYRQVETNGQRNITFGSGTIRFWFRTDWSSASAGGSGPGNLGSFIAVNADAAHNWGLWVDPTGDNLQFGATNGDHIFVCDPVSITWSSNQSHQIAITYNQTEGAVYVDGNLAITSLGPIGFWPMTNFFDIGSDQTNHQIRARIDELETFNYAMGSYRIWEDWASVGGLRLAIVSGNNQNVTNPMSTLPVPLKVLATDNQGGLLANATVRFSALHGANFLVGGSISASPAVVTTGADGTASVYAIPFSVSDPTNWIVASLTRGTNITSVQFAVISQFTEAAGEGTPTRLGHWIFDATNWAGDSGQLPLATSNLVLTSGLSGNAVKLDLANPCMLSYRHSETNGHRNLDLRQGTVRFWLRPDWAGLGTGGYGLGSPTTLISATQDATHAWNLICGQYGSELTFSAVNGSDTYSYLDAWYGVKLASNQWAQITLTYTPTNCTIYLNGVSVATGGGVAYWPNSTSFTVGTDSSNNQIRGSIDELETFNYALDSGRVWSDYLTIAGTNGNVGNYFNGAVPVLKIISGSQQSGTNADAFLPSPLTVQLTDTHTNLLTNALISFAVTQGGVQIAATTNGTPGSTLTLQTGTDGRASAMVLVTAASAGTNVIAASVMCGTNSASTNFTATAVFEDGISQLTNSRLGYWKFDSNAFTNEQGQAPIIATNLLLTVGVSSNAVAVDSNATCQLRYHRVGTSGKTIALSSGAIRFWFSPHWASVSQGGTGVTNGSSFMSCASDTNHFWSLGVDAGASNLVFSGVNGSHQFTYLKAPISWISNQFHQVVLNYSVTNSQLYIDGNLATAGGGVAYWPQPDLFDLGRDAFGRQIRGVFDEFETFNYSLASQDISSNVVGIANLDTDGDGLPDIYEKFVTGTDPTLYDTGNTGVGDGYRDPDGDGYSNNDEYRNGTSPFRWDAPPAPGSLQANPGSGNATLSWNAGLGSVLYYVIERADPTDRYGHYGAFHQIGTVTNALSFQDNSGPVIQAPFGGFGETVPPAFEVNNSKYHVKAVYSGGSSQATDVTLNNGDPKLTIEARLVRNANGKWQVVCQNMPTNVVNLRFNWMYWDYFSDMGSFLSSNSVPAANFSSGIYVIPDSEITNHVSVIFDPAQGPEPSMAQQLWIQGMDASGKVGLAVNAGLLPQDLPFFVDGRAHLKQNVLFQLRAATQHQPSSLCDSAWSNPFYENFPVPSFTNYVESGLVHQSIQWKQYGGDFMGAYYAQLNNLWPFNAHYQFHASYYDPTNTVPPSFQSPGTFTTVPGPAILGLPDPYWVHQDFNNLPEVAAANSGYSVSLQSSAHNLFGLSFAPALVNTPFEDDAGGQAVLVPATTLAPGNSISLDSVNPAAFCDQTVDPVLQPVDYYFTSISSSGTCLINYSPTVTDQPYPAPVFPGFAVSNQTPVLVASVGETARVAGWQKLRISNGDTNKFAYLGQYFSQALKIATNGAVTTTNTGILSPYGEFFPTEPGPVALVTMPSDTNSSLCGTTAVHVISLTVDANHDGAMDFSYYGPDQTTPSRPYKFWVNDCNDVGDYGGDGIPGNGKPRSYCSSIPGIGVSGRRALVNFFAVQVNIQSLLRSLPSLSTLSFFLSHADDNNLYYMETGLGPNNFQDYLQTTNFLAYLPSGGTAGYARQYGIYPLSTNFLARLRDQNQGIILVEAFAPTTNPLVLSVYQGTKLVAQSSLYLSITGVEQMFRHKNLMSNSLPYTSEGPNDRLTDSSVTNEPDTNGKNFVFVHGYNVLPNEARGTFADVFKRMYWSGSHAKFYGVTWRGASTKGTYPFGDALTPNYHTNVVNAFQTAPYLASFVASLTNSGPVTLVAHSLGNMVTLSAINDWNAPISQYFMMDAAVPVEAIDPAATTNMMVYSTWAGYSNRLFSSAWYKLFPSDARNTLTWNNRLGNLRNVDVYNFFSSGEEVLRTTTADPPLSALNMVVQQATYHFWDGFPFGSFTWYWQEKGKGTASQNWFLGSDHGGWQFSASPVYNNVYCIGNDCVTNVLYPYQVTNVPDAQLRTNAFFQMTSISHSADAALYGTNGANAGQYAQTNGNRILADTIPAMSVVAGANPVPKLKPQNGDDKNIDMMTFKNNWPTGRTGTELGMWHHSDYHEVAYVFTYKLFDQYVTLGNLK